MCRDANRLITSTDLVSTKLEEIYKSGALIKGKGSLLRILEYLEENFKSSNVFYEIGDELKQKLVQLRTELEDENSAHVEYLIGEIRQDVLLWDSKASETEDMLEKSKEDLASIAQAINIWVSEAILAHKALCEGFAREFFDR
ncbi:hypothetical protein ABW19_dt0203704 [Dactylella cylindrospora]|nr:hypothetical protein ABW19_dt0203704 [Dactylella cylindrospora]